jgi:hypothetical protein
MCRDSSASRRCSRERGAAAVHCSSAATPCNAAQGEGRASCGGLGVSQQRYVLLAGGGGRLASAHAYVAGCVVL